MSGEMIGRGRIASNDVGLLRTGRMVPAHDGAAGRGAGGCGRVGLPKLDALFCQGIDVGSLHGGGGVDVVAFYILPAEVIGENEDNVGLSWACGAGVEGAKESEREEKKKRSHEDRIDESEIEGEPEF